MEEREHLLGVVTKGSLTEGLEMKLNPAGSVEDLKAGKFVVIQGQKHDFFGLITDMKLDASHPHILVHPPEEEEALWREVLAGDGTYATVALRPMLMLPREEPEAEPQPVKTIPGHFAPVFEAREGDVNRIFGDERASPSHFYIGQPLDMETPVCLDLERFVERSNGIFGKTGTGKTFLTRLVLSGLIHRKHGEVVNLIFDMHNEYGWSAQVEGGRGAFVKGLKQLFGSRVAIFSLNPESTHRRGTKPDVEVHLAYEDIHVEDIAPLQDELRLNVTAVESAYAVVARYGKEWLQALLEADIKELAEEVRAHPESLSALQRKLRLLKFPFLHRERKGPDVIQTMMEHIQRGTHIVLEFGPQTSLLCYLLVANIITRRIHESYVRQTERYQATQNPADRPRHLVITIEEAHKFLSPAAARQTTFGTIAREMRKYYVTLLIIDQRPSGIDDEILSQIGTRIIAQLNDEKDLQAVLTGTSGTSGLRSVLASLDSRQQALVLGHAVPMPVVIRTRNYDEEFYAALGASALTLEEEQAQLESDLAAVFGT